MSHISKSSNFTEIVNVSNLILTCNVNAKYKDSSVSFLVEKQALEFFKYLFPIGIVFLTLYAFAVSNIIVICFIALSCFFVVNLLTCTVRKESVYLFVPVGLQINAVFLFGNKSSTFIPWSSIRDFLIVEVISRQRVLYCLIVLVEDSNGSSYVTLFENTKPRLIILEKVYKKLQTILIEQKKRSSK